MFVFQKNLRRQATKLGRIFVLIAFATSTPFAATAAMPSSEIEFFGLHLGMSTENTKKAFQEKGVVKFLAWPGSIVSENLIRQEAAAGNQGPCFHNTTDKASADDKMQCFFTPDPKRGPGVSSIVVFFREGKLVGLAAGFDPRFGSLALKRLQEIFGKPPGNPIPMTKRYIRHFLGEEALVNCFGLRKCFGLAWYVGAPSNKQSAILIYRGSNSADGEALFLEMRDQKQIKERNDDAAKALGF